MRSKTPPRASKKSASLLRQPHRTLVKVLAQIAKSSRYPLINGVPLLHLLGEKSAQFPTLQELTLGQLTEMADAEISAVSSLAPTVAKQLTAALRPFSVDTHGASKTSRKISSKKVVALDTKKVLKPKPEAAITTVEAERRLNDACQRLRACPHFEKLKELRLGAFWDPQSPRAPFEEEVTLRQFSELKMEALVRKRSVGPEKILAVITAVERALATSVDALPFEWKSRDLAPPDAASSSHVYKSRAKVSPLSLSPKHKKVSPSVWGLPTGPLPSYAYPVLTFFEAQFKIAKSASVNTPIARILARIPETISPDNFMILWFLHNHPATVVAQMVGMEQKEVVRRAALAQSTLHHIVVDWCPEVTQYWTSAIESSETERTDDTNLCNPYFDSALDADLQKSVLLLALSTFRKAR